MHTLTTCATFGVVSILVGFAIVGCSSSSTPTNQCQGAACGDSGVSAPMDASASNVDASPSNDAGGGSSSTCTATFSGAVTGTCGCTAFIDSSGSTWAVAIVGMGEISGSMATFKQVAIEFPGAPMATTLTAGTDQGTVTVTSSAASWIATGSPTTDKIGSLSVAITTLGPAQDNNGTQIYTMLHGTANATLIDRSSSSSPQLTMSITF